MYKILLMITTLIITASCNKKIKEHIGVVTPGPNEYKVQRSKTLEVPPHYDLPTPHQTSSKSDASSDTEHLNDAEKALIEEIK